MIYVLRGWSQYLYISSFFFFLEFPKCVSGGGQAEGLRFNLPALKWGGVLCGGNRSVTLPSALPPPPSAPLAALRPLLLWLPSGEQRCAGGGLTHSLSFAPSPSQLKNPTEQSEFHIFSERAQISAGRTPREEEIWHKRCVKTRVKKPFKNNWDS